MKISNWMLAGLASVLSVAAVAQAPAGAAPAQKAPAAPAAPPLVLNSLDPTTKADPFPPVNPKFFTAASPTVDTVNSFLKQLWGYDANRIWRVEAIQATPAPGVAKVVVFVSDKSPNAKVQTTAFFVTPDGNHALAGDGVVPFGATPFAETRKLLQARADGASRGVAGKDFMLVEFADLQCPHCAEAQHTMDQLVKDFPNARVVYQSFPLTDIHPFAFKAAAYGYCVQKQKNDAYFPYAAAVYDAQAALTPETGDATLKSAVTKAGLDPAAIDTCAVTQATKDAVDASIKLAQDVGVDQTPSIAVNGHVLPLTQIPYETLKTIITYQAAIDGATGATSLETRRVPSLGK
ncbi:DsbA family protein [Granulicella sp. dw_53]|uniref:DsbA family protein n=1 Tax=Granulicella sp. dw_53 TaxID=2719792 RepID=UPI0021026CEF|nr:DsbA family protein [Granulicella sp. dw_53]